MSQPSLLCSLSVTAYRALLDNYEAETGNAEEVSEEEFQENVRFINLIMETPVMMRAHEYLVEEGKAPEELDDFKRLLYKIWFKLYRRQREDRSVEATVVLWSICLPYYIYAKRIDSRL